jgi:glutathione transport system permease protein
MVNDGRKFITNAPHLLFFPGGAIFITVLAFVFVGDGLRDALDPKLK